MSDEAPVLRVSALAKTFRIGFFRAGFLRAVVSRVVDFRRVGFLRFALRRLVFLNQSFSPFSPRCPLSIRWGMPGQSSR